MSRAAERTLQLRRGISQYLMVVNSESSAVSAPPALEGQEQQRSLGQLLCPGPAHPSMAQHGPVQPSMTGGAVGQQDSLLENYQEKFYHRNFSPCSFTKGIAAAVGFGCFVCLLTAFPAAPPLCVCTAQALVVTAGQKLSAARDAAVISNRRHKLEQINLNQIQFLAQSLRSRCQSAPTIN